MARKQCVGILLPGTENYAFLPRAKPSEVQSGDPLTSSNLTVEQVEHSESVYYATLSDGGAT